MVSRYRKVSATNDGEALEARVLGTVNNSDGSCGISLGNISSWPQEVDFITYARDENGALDESTRVVWVGEKENDTYVVARRTGGSEVHVPDATNFATVVPSHCWANDLVSGVEASLPGDGGGGINQAGKAGLPLEFVVSATKPAAVAGRTVVWLRPLE